MHEEEYAKGSKLHPKTWLRLLPYMKPLWKHLLLVCVLTLISSVLEASYPMFTRYAVNNFIMKQSTDGVGLFTLLFAGAIAVNAFTVVIFARHAMIVDCRLGQSLREHTFLHLQELSVDFYAKNSVGYLIARLMSDSGRISELISWGIINLLWGVVYIAGIIFFMFTMSWQLAIISAAILPIAALIVTAGQSKVIKLNRRMRELNSRITGAFNEGVTGAKTSKILAVEDKFTDEFKGTTSAMSLAARKTAAFQSILAQIVAFFGSIAVGAVLYRGGWLVEFGWLDFGILAAFITYVTSLMNPIADAVSLLEDALAAQTALERVTGLIDAEVTISDTPEVVAKYGDVFHAKRENWEPIIGDVEFENVWFRYPGTEQYILRDFSLKIPAGTSVAIVGETGAGKSTIVNLACRFYEPEKGRVLIDGRDSRERSQLWLHSSLGYVLQDPHLFSGSIRENIRYGKLDASDIEVEASAKLVSADVVAERCEKGYDTEVGEGGAALSTGEKQLVSFARAVLANPPIFVLDEATSSIDTETEKLIQDAIGNVLTGRTSFIIAHRLSTITRCDIILVVEDGDITERGTHAELIAQGGHYKRLFDAMKLEEENI